MFINSINNKIDKKYTKGGGGLPADSGPYIGVVMNNHDPNRTGRVEVWLKSFSGNNKNDESTWRTVSYLSPFYGNTPHVVSDTTSKDSSFKNNAQSYGMWMTAPDLGVEVVCIFIDGDPNFGFYIGYIPQPQMNHMIPGAGARPNESVSKSSTPEESAKFANASQLPTVEIKRSNDNMHNPDYYNTEKPTHTQLSMQLWKQGTITDNVRGPIGSSSQRESPSYTYGISTPGRPIYSDTSGSLVEGKMRGSLEKGKVTKADLKVKNRRIGHSFIMDDGDINGKDMLVRLRSSSGHQITMSDDGGAIYIQHANGLTWIELGNEGTIDLFSTNSINLRSHGEINLHADKNINFYSGQDINMYSKRNTKLEAEVNFDVIGKLKTSIYSTKTILVKSDGILSTQSRQLTTIKAGGNIIEQSDAKILMNSGGANSIVVPEFIAHTKLPDTEKVEPTGWESKPGVLDSIVSRAPTHEPYAFHNQGVPVPVVVGAPSKPPSQPAPSKSQAILNQTKEQPPVPNPVETANVVDQVNSVKPSKSIGPLDKSNIAATLSQHSKSVNQAVNTISEKGLGSFALQPKHFGDLDLLKPGMIDLKSTSVAKAFELMKDPAMFTGKDGINSLKDVLNNEQLQGDIVQKGMDKTFNALKQTGFMTGLESAGDSASLIGTSLVATYDEVIDWASSDNPGDIINNVTGGITDIIKNPLSAIMNTTSKASNFASDLVEGSANQVVSLITDSAGNIKGITNKINNIDLTSIDNAVDNIIDNINIPSAASISNNIKSVIDPTFSAAEDILSKVTDIELNDITGLVNENISNSIIKTDDSVFNAPVGVDDKGQPLYSVSSTILSSGIDIAAKEVIATKIPIGIKQITRFI